MLMRLRISELKSIVRQAIVEAGGATRPTKPVPYDGQQQDSLDAMSREQLDSIDADELDTEGDFDELSTHLREPVVEPEDTFGPVPPTEEEPYVGQDPFVRDYSVLTSPGSRRKN